MRKKALLLIIMMCCVSMILTPAEAVYTYENGVKQVYIHETRAISDTIFGFRETITKKLEVADPSYKIEQQELIGIADDIQEAFLYDYERTSVKLETIYIHVEVIGAGIISGAQAKVALTFNLSTINNNYYAFADVQPVALGFDEESMDVDVVTIEGINMQYDDIAGKIITVTFTSLFTPSNQADIAVVMTFDYLVRWVPHFSAAIMILIGSSGFLLIVIVVLWKKDRR